MEVENKTPFFNTIEGIISSIYKYSFQKSWNTPTWLPWKLLDKLSKEERTELKIIVNEASKGAYIAERSLLGAKVIKTIPDGSIIKALENKLNPKYMNSVFTWRQIQKAITEF